MTTRKRVFPKNVPKPLPCLQCRKIMSYACKIEMRRVPIPPEPQYNGVTGFMSKPVPVGVQRMGYNKFGCFCSLKCGYRYAIERLLPSVLKARIEHVEAADREYRKALQENAVAE